MKDNGMPSSVTVSLIFLEVMVKPNVVVDPSD